MFDRLIRLDWWVIQRFERFTQWTQTWWGITAFMWAKWMIYGAIIGIAWAMMDIPGVFSKFYHSLFILVFISRVYTMEEPPEPKGDEMYYNPSVIEDRRVRLTSVIFSPVISLILIKDPTPMLLWPICAAFHWYFMACSTHPKSKSKIKQFVESLSTSLQPVKGEQ